MKTFERELNNNELFAGLDIADSPKATVKALIAPTAYWQHEVCDGPQYNLIIRRIAASKYELANNKFIKAGAGEMVDNQIATYDATAKVLCRNACIYMSSDDPNYPRYLLDIQCAMATGRPAKGNKNDPWKGHKFKNLLKMTPAEIKRAKVVKPLKKHGRPTTKNAVPVVKTAKPAFDICEKCKQMEALRIIDKVLNKEVK